MNPRHSNPPTQDTGTIKCIYGTTLKTGYRGQPLGQIRTIALEHEGFGGTRPLDESYVMYLQSHGNARDI